MELLASGALGAAVVFGFRHGFDWDHLAALSDLTGSQTTPRRSMRLASLYALGHACMVVILGIVAIVFAEQIPEPVDVVTERLVGATLLGLGLWIAWTAIHTRGAPPPRSRWMLLLEAVQRIRRRGRDSEVAVEHSHLHDHYHRTHSHSHDAAVEQDSPAPVGVDGAGLVVASVGVELTLRHSHPHHHVGPAPRDPFMTYGSWSAFGIGVLHGVGAETPTQILMFATAAQASDRLSSIALLLCFVVGLVTANTVVAAASTLGFRGVLRNRIVPVVLATVTAGFSLVVGSLLILGRSDALPTTLGG